GGDDMAGDPANAAGRCIALGTVAGSLFAYFDSLSTGWINQAMYPSAIAVGIGTAAMVEFCETFLRSKDRAQVVGAIIASVVWIGLVLVLSQRLPSLSNGLVMLLCASVWAASTDYVTRRWRIAQGRYRFEVALLGALFGTALGLILVVQADAGAERNYWFSALSGVLPGVIIALASLRRRLWTTANNSRRRGFSRR